MKTGIRTREELLLAMIAGEAVNINTMTPPVVADTREYWLVKIAERIASAISGNPSAATTQEAGTVKMAANVAAAAGDAPTAAEFKALLDALKAAGIMAPDSNG